MRPHTTPGANVDAIPDGFCLTIPAGNDRRYRVAQLDDYTNLARGHFPAHPPLTLGLLARASASSLPGTWGFGLWNDPFGLSLGFGGNPWRLPALPNAAWFFHASGENHLSFGEKPGNGFLAQVFRSPAIPSALLALAGIPALPLLATRKSRGILRKLTGRVVREDGVRLGADVTAWHGYRLEWSPMRCAFWVDDALVLESPVSPRPPLGLVIWIDNQYAAFTPEGKIGFGVLANAEPAWLEVKNIDVR
ncbi:MAG: hypothetical protein ACOYYU_12320 [Chloroflexota bacterium]